MGKTILLVEDDVIISLAETKDLKKEGYSVINAHNGIAAVEKARRNAGNIDLILMDINLGPGMDGPEAALKILEEQDIPILFLSSHTEKEIVDKTEKITSYGYVVKNTGITVLNASIKMAFKLHDANTRIQEKNNEIEKAYEKLTAINEELIRSKKDLMVSDVQYRLLADNMSDTVWLMDMNLKTVYVSPSVIRTRGFTLDELNEMPLEAHLPPDSYRRAMGLLAEALLPENLNGAAPRANYSIELEFYRKDGSAFLSEIVFTLIFDEYGKPANILGCGRDITERKRMEDALRESEKQVRRKLDAVLSPEADIGALELSDIIDHEKIQKLMDEFHRLTNIGIGIIDLRGKVLVATGWQDICTMYHRVHPETNRLCIESDLELSRDLPQGTFKQYRCKNNMWDIATPIIIGDRHVGNIFLGQFLFEDEEPDYEIFRQEASRYGFKEREYLAALDKVPRWSRETVHNAMSFYAAFSGMVGHLSYSNIKLANVLEAKKLAEEAQRSMNRELLAISECNQALLRAVDENTLLHDICGIICDKGGYRLAWVGYAECDDAKTVRPVAWAGFDEGYLENANITWADTEYGRGPTGTAIRSGRSVRVQDFMTDVQVEPWRDTASKYGYRSTAALPLKDENARTFGNLTLFATEPGAFTDSEMRLLEELANDLGFGITMLRIRKERDLSMRELQKSNDLLNAVIEAAPTAVIGLDLDGRVHSVWNKAAEKMLGWSVEEVMGRYLPSVPAEKKEEFTRFREVIRNGEILNGIDVRRQRRDGTLIDYSIYASPLHDQLGQITGNVAVLVDITERKRMEEELRKSERNKTILNRLQSIFLSIEDDELYGRILSVILEVFESGLGIFGFIAENGDLVIPSLTTQVWSDCQVPGKSIVFSAESWGESLWGRAIRDRASFCSTGPFHTPEGHVQIENFLTAPVVFGNKAIGVISVANSENAYTEEDIELLESIAHSISPILNARLQRDRQDKERRRAEAGLRRANRSFRTLSEVNHVLARSTTEPDLLREICRLIVEYGGYQMAWIGFAEHDESRSVRPAAAAGFEEGYLERTRVSWADNEYGRGPMGSSIRSGQPVVCRDVTADPCFAPWQEDAARYGYASLIALPIRMDDKVLGAVGIYASEPDAFDNTETELLSELVDDLAFGLKSLQVREERLRAEEALRESETRYRIVADNTFDWEFWLDPDRQLRYNSLSCERITGYTAREFERDPDLFFRIIHPDDREAFLRHNIEVMEKQESGGLVIRIVRPDGELRWMEHLCQPVYDDAGVFTGSRGSNRDITSRKTGENVMAARLRLLEFAGSHTMDETLTAVLDELEALTGSSIGFYHFLEADQKMLSLQNWSTNTLKVMCGAAGKGEHYDVSRAGVWVDCVHQRRPVIHNDYAALPHRKGMPEGHARVVREAVVPVFRGNLIVAIIGVGNKSTLYTEDDISAISKLGDLSWDIVELKRAEVVLKESESRFRSIYENFSLGYQSLDSEGRFLDVNQAWLDMLGYEREEVVGRLFDEFLAPNYADSFRERFSRFKSEGKVAAEFGMKRKDGSAAIIAINGRIGRDINGNFKQTHCIVADITVKRTEETAVLSAKNAWEKTFDALPIFIALIGNDHRILRINRAMAAQFGKAPSDYIGMRCHELIHGLPEPPEFCPHCLTMKDGLPHRVEIYEKRFDKWFSVNTVPLTDEKGTHVSSTHVMTDITERKRSEREILASLSEKEMLLRELQHRVKNSMALITSLIGLERDRTPNLDSRTILDNLKYRVSSMENLYEFLHNTGDISNVGLDEYISSLVDSLANAFVSDADTVHIRKELQPVVVDVKNAMAWGLIVNELFTNALKYAFPAKTSGHIRVVLTKSAGFINLAVKDNGQGPPTDFTIEKTLGFGIKLVSLLTEQLGGTFNFNRDPENSFEIRVPHLPHV